MPLCQGAPQVRDVLLLYSWIAPLSCVNSHKSHICRDKLHIYLCEGTRSRPTPRR